MSEWIRVEDELPNPLEWILVDFRQNSINGRSVKFVAFMDEREEWALRSAPESDFPINKELLIPFRWMPLPE